MLTKKGNIYVTNGYKSGFNKGIYIGRGGRGFRGSPLANPYTLGKHTREEALDLYEAWLLRKLKDPKSAQSIELTRLVNLVKNGTDINLICFCAPKPCHGDIIKNIIEENLYE